MKKERRTLKAGFIHALLLFALTMSAWSAPSTITIQGKLTNSASKPLTGTRVWRVQFYDASSGGNALGAVLTGSTTLSATGRFSFEVVPPFQVLKSNGALYYELAIDSAATPDGIIGPSDVFPTRLKVTSVMWTLRAAQADLATTATSAINATYLAGLPASNYASTTALASGLAGKSDLSHTHLLQELGGMVTDAQVPDDITINFAKAAGTASTATLALNATDAAHAKFADLAATATVALNAKDANHATLADLATTSTYAGTATTATVALASLSAKNAGSANSATTATYALAASTALTANSAAQAAQLGGHPATDFALQSAMTTALAGKSDITHTHLLQNLGGMVTDAQVPDDITINFAKAAGNATTATTALSAKSAGSANTATTATVALNYTEKDTLASVTGRGASTSNAITLTNITDTTASGAMVSGALAVSGGVGIAKKLSVAGDAIIGGNLYTNGGTRLLTWQPITANTQAQSGYGYMVNNAANVVNVTLPASPSVGDVIRVSGQGLGGWKVTQNVGQKITLRGLNIRNYKAFVKKGTNFGFDGCAMSADGNRLAATVNGGQLYTSDDWGTTWTVRIAGNKNWRQVAVTPDGSTMIAAEENGYLWVSSNGGHLWTPVMNDAPRAWYTVAVSDDGTKMVAGVGGWSGTFGNIYTSTDGGATWTSRASSHGWSGVACSADGSVMVAAAYGNYVYASTDGGVTWNPRISDANRNWVMVMMTPDAAKMVAVDYSSYPFISTDQGVTWTPRYGMTRGYFGAMSADGNTICLGNNQDSKLYVSTDGGISWDNKGGVYGWNYIALSSSKDWLYGGTSYNQITGIHAAYLPETTLGASGYLSGGAEAAVELQYVGGGVFRPLSFSGALGAK